MFSDLRLGLIH